MNDKRSIGILVPCFNEEVVLPQFYARVQKVIESLDSVDFHYVFINDGSSDRTIEIMHEFRKKFPRAYS